MPYMAAPAIARAGTTPASLAVAIIVERHGGGKQLLHLSWHSRQLPALRMGSGLGASLAYGTLGPILGSLLEVVQASYRLFAAREDAQALRRAGGGIVGGRLGESESTVASSSSGFVAAGCIVC